MYNYSQDIVAINTDSYPTVFVLTALFIVDRKLVGITKSCCCSTTSVRSQQ